MTPSYESQPSPTLHEGIYVSLVETFAALSWHARRRSAHLGPTSRMTRREPPPVEKKRRGGPQKRRKDQGSASALAVLPEDVATVPTDQVAPQEARRARRSHWVYVVDIPSVETPITTRTRSGRL